MSTLTLMAGAILTLAAGLVYAYVGHRIGGRKVEPYATLPRNAFSAWWQALAATTIIDALATMLAAFRLLAADLYVALTYFKLMLLAFALGSLLYYLVFLFTGKRHWWRAIIAGYAAYLVFLIYFVRSHQPLGIEVQRWRIDVDYGLPFEGDPLLAWVLVLLLGPQLLFALAYLTLAFRVRERTLKYRIWVVALSILVWFTSALAASFSGLSDTDAWQVASRLIGLCAALAILAAYFPPAILRRRLRLVSINEPVPEAA